MNIFILLRFFILGVYLLSVYSYLHDEYGVYFGSNLNDVFMTEDICLNIAFVDD